MTREHDIEVRLARSADGIEAAQRRRCEAGEPRPVARRLAA